MNNSGVDLDRLTGSMMRAGGLLRRVRRREASGLGGLEPFHLEILDELARGPVRITRLATVQGEQLSTVSRRLTRLVDLDLVRKRAHPDDRRVQVAELTPAGRRVLNRVEQQRRDVVGEVLGDWEPEELAELERLMERIARQLEAG